MAPCGHVRRTQIAATTRPTPDASSAHRYRGDLRAVEVVFSSVRNRPYRRMRFRGRAPEAESSESTTRTWARGRGAVVITLDVTPAAARVRDVCRTPGAKYRPSDSSPAPFIRSCANA